MSTLDEEIAKALNAEDRAIAQQFEELGLIGQFKSVFHGKTAWLSSVILIYSIVLTGLFFYSAWKFVALTEVSDKLLWGGAAWFLATMIAFMKVWFWLRMESNRIVREIKRLELQIARSHK